MPVRDATRSCWTAVHSCDDVYLYDDDDGCDCLLVPLYLLSVLLLGGDESLKLRLKLFFRLLFHQWGTSGFRWYL